MKEAISTDIKTIIIREFYGQLYAKILEHLNEMDKPRKFNFPKLKKNKIKIEAEVMNHPITVKEIN